MTGWKTLLAFILIVPALGFAAAAGVKQNLDGQLRAVLRAEVPDATAEQIAKTSLSWMCDSGEPALAEACGIWATMGWVQAASVASVVLGLLLVAGVTAAGRRARGDRTLLLRIFRPGLHVTAFLLVVLVVLHALIALVGGWYFESIVVGRVHFVVLAAIGIGAVLGITAIVRNVFAIVQDSTLPVLGQAVSRERAPQLWARIDGIAARLGALAPDHLVLGLEPNFFVTESSVTSFSGHAAGRTLFCSMPLMRILDRSEFDAIVGHELGHYKGEDTRFSREFYPIYRRTSDSIEQLRAAGGSGSASIALAPAIALFSYFLEAFARAESEIGRERELAADREGVEAAGAAAAATALVKVHAYADAWLPVQEFAIGNLRNGKAVVNASLLYATVVEENLANVAFEGLAAARAVHPIDSHPPLGVRLDALGLSIAQVEARARVIAPADPALGLVAGADELEESVSESYQQFMVEQLGIEPPADAPGEPA
jgi:Zn-dependent protease with chaperone function